MCGEWGWLVGGRWFAVRAERLIMYTWKMQGIQAIQWLDCELRSCRSQLPETMTRLLSESAGKQAFEARVCRSETAPDPSLRKLLRAIPALSESQ